MAKGEIGGKEREARVVENGEAKEEEAKDGEKEKARAGTYIASTSWVHGEVMTAGTLAAEESNGAKIHGARSHGEEMD